ncbi:unnamed protein product [Symbiodinium sp. CCMP2592]|nr:unnamed protein product [Symbiodinium sp. CCMP2592]
MQEATLPRLATAADLSNDQWSSGAQDLSGRRLWGLGATARLSVEFGHDRIRIANLVVSKHDPCQQQRHQSIAYGKEQVTWPHGVSIPRLRLEVHRTLFPPFFWAFADIASVNSRVRVPCMSVHT